MGRDGERRPRVLTERVQRSRAVVNGADEIADIGALKRVDDRGRSVGDAVDGQIVGSPVTDAQHANFLDEFGRVRGLTRPDAYEVRALWPRERARLDRLAGF